MKKTMLLVLGLIMGLSTPVYSAGPFETQVRHTPAPTIRGGSAAAPGLGCNTDRDTGIFCSANILSFSTNGIERMRLNADGSVVLTDGGVLHTDMEAADLVVIRNGADETGFIDMVSTGANAGGALITDRKSTRPNSSHRQNPY